MKKFIIAIGLTLFAAMPTNAQQQRYIDVGLDREGRQVVLDRNSIDKSRNQFTLVSKYGDGFTVERYAVNCQKQIFTLIAVRLYDGNQNLITATDDEPTDPRVYDANTPVGRSAAIVCGNSNR